MLQIYDRVLASRSVPTLVALSFGLVIAYLFQGLLEIIRTRVVTRIGAIFDRTLSGPVHECVIRLSIKTRKGGDAIQPVRDLDQVRTFLTSAGPLSVLDMPWVPIFLIICFLIHPWIGFVALIGALLLMVLAFLTERNSRAPAKALSEEASARASSIEADRRNSESVVAMGMQPMLSKRWTEINDRYLAASTCSSDVVGSYGGLSRVVRLLLQSVILGVGAYLVILNEVSAGAMVASSIMMGRALAPIETAIANWRGFVGARQALDRLSKVLTSASGSKITALPAPCKSLKVENLAVAAPGGQATILRDIRFQIEAGEALGIVGPSGAGKTSLVRTIVGIWPPAQGGIRIDGAALDQWEPAELGRHVGYVSQSVDLFEGTVSDNISRMSEKPDSEAVLAAARAAGAHDMILKLPQGYDTRVGDAGAILSAGQRQRIGLARALFGNPFLVALDEPHANLDTEGEKALTQALLDAKTRGAIVVMIAHRPSALVACDKVLFVSNGQQVAFGPRDEVMQQIMPRPPGASASGATNLKVVANDKDLA